MTVRKNIKISIVISFLTMIISVLVHIFYTPFMLSKIGDKQYGLYNFITSTLSWLTVAVNAILSAYNKIISEEIAKDPEKGEEKTNGIYGLIVTIWASIISIVSCIIIVLLYNNVISFSAYNSDDQQTLLILFILVAIQMVITVLTRVSNLNITYNNHHIWVKIGLLIIAILPPVISIPFLVRGCNIITIALITIVTNIFVHIADLLFDRFILKKKLFVRPTKEIRNLLKPVFLFCSIILINEIAYQIDCSIDNMVLGFKGYSEQITLYTLAAYIVTTTQNCISLIYTPLIPTIFKNESLGLREKNKQLYDLITFGQLLIWMLITGGFLSCGSYFTKLWIGEDRFIVFYICISLFIIRSFSACSGPARDMMRASNHHKQRAALAVISALINLITTIILVNIFDEKSAIWACIIGTALSSIICWWIIANVLNVKYLRLNIKKYMKHYLIVGGVTLFSSVIAFGLTLLLKINNNFVNLLIGGTMFVVIYIPLIFILNKTDVIALYKLLRAK